MTTNCQGMECECGIILISPVCCDATVDAEEPLPNINLKVQLSDPNGLSGPWYDANGGIVMGGTIWQVNTQAANYGTEAYLDAGGGLLEILEYNGCDYWAARTCPLPANYDSSQGEGDAYPGTYLSGSQGSQYRVTGTILGQTLPGITFQIDAAATPELIDGCVNLATVDIEAPLLPPDPGCTLVTSCLCASLEAVGFSIEPTNNEETLARIEVNKIDACTWEIQWVGETRTFCQQVKAQPDGLGLPSTVLGVSPGGACALYPFDVFGGGGGGGPSDGGLWEWDGLGSCPGLPGDIDLPWLAYSTLDSPTSISTPFVWVPSAFTPADPENPTEQEICDAWVSFIDPATLCQQIKALPDGLGLPDTLLGVSPGDVCALYPRSVLTEQSGFVDWDGLSTCPPLPPNVAGTWAAVDLSNLPVSVNVPLYWVAANYSPVDPENPTEQEICDAWVQFPDCAAITVDDLCDAINNTPFVPGVVAERYLGLVRDEADELVCQVLNKGLYERVVFDPTNPAQVDENGTPLALPTQTNSNADAFAKYLDGGTYKFCGPTHVWLAGTWEKLECNDPNCGCSSAGDDCVWTITRDGWNGTAGGFTQYIWSPPDSEVIALDSEAVGDYTFLEGFTGGDDTDGLPTHANTPTTTIATVDVSALYTSPDIGTDDDTTQVLWRGVVLVEAPAATVTFTDPSAVVDASALYYRHATSAPDPFEQAWDWQDSQGTAPTAVIPTTDQLGNPCPTVCVVGRPGDFYPIEIAHYGHNRTQSGAWQLFMGVNGAEPVAIAVGDQYPTLTHDNTITVTTLPEGEQPILQACETAVSTCGDTLP